MYLQHFGLTSYPFSIAPDADVIYYNEQYRDAYAHLHYSIQHPGGIIILTGEVGTGKTTLVRSFLNRQDNQKVHAAYIFNPIQSVPNLLDSICQEFGIKTGRNNSCNKLIDRLYEFLIQQHRKQERALIIIDEAQHLDFESLEYLRLLTNLETGVSKLLQIILVGQEELLLKLAQPELRQFNQRTVGRFHLRSLNEHQLYDYIQYRLGISNGNAAIFPLSLRKLLFQYTKGIPRVTNILCDRALVGAYAQNRSRVDKKILKKAAAELFIDTEYLTQALPHTDKQATPQSFKKPDTGADSKRSEYMSQPVVTVVPEIMPEPAALQPTDRTTTTKHQKLRGFSRKKNKPVQGVVSEQPEFTSTYVLNFVAAPAIRFCIVLIAIIAGGWIFTEAPLGARTVENLSKQPVAEEISTLVLIDNTSDTNPQQQAIFPNDTATQTKNTTTNTLEPLDAIIDTPQQVFHQLQQTEVTQPPPPLTSQQQPATVTQTIISEELEKKESPISSVLLRDESPILLAQTIDSLDTIPATSALYQDYSALLDLWGVNYTFSSQELPCLTVHEFQLTCAHIKADIDLIREINLPTIIEWQDQENTKNLTALLVGFDETNAIIFRDGSYYHISNEKLSKSWKGYGHYFIRAPKDFRSAFRPRSTSDSIIWLIQALTEIDGKYSLNQVSKTYNEQLVQTVKTFQKQQGLIADGIVGFETLARLNHLLYQAPQLEHKK